MQIVGIIIALATAVFWGVVEKKRGAGAADGEEVSGTLQEEIREYARPKLFWFNLILTLVVIVCLIFVKVPAYYVFMIGCAIALLVNFHGASLQNKIIKSHAGPEIMMSSTILCAGVFLGVMENTGIMNNMATFLGIRLADVEIKDHIKRCFPWIWGVSIICLIVGLVLGVVRF